MSWDQYRVELLTKLFNDGLSASFIAARVSATGFHVTRNAVIGKLHRLGLGGQRSTKPRTARRYKPKKLAPRKEKPWAQYERKSAKLFASEPYTPGPELVIPPEERKGILALERNDCRWPIGDPQLPDFHFCNGKKVPGLPYCEVHCRRAYTPPQPHRKSIANVVQFYDVPGKLDPLRGATINTGEKVDA